MGDSTSILKQLSLSLNLCYIRLTFLIECTVHSCKAELNHYKSWLFEILGYIFKGSNPTNPYATLLTKTDL